MTTITANSLSAEEEELGDGTDVASGTHLEPGPGTMIANRCSAEDADMDGGVALTDMTPLATSNEIRDRGSSFVGDIYRARTTEEAKAVVGWRRQRDLGRVERDRNSYRHRYYGPGERKGGGNGDDDSLRDRNANVENNNNNNLQNGGTPYTIAAWRCMVVKRGRTGLGGPDEFEVEGAAEDGGERYAGKKVLAVMQREGVIDAVLIVSRRFGGTLLGPARFSHIETCASEVCRKFKRIEEMDECIQTLERLDDVLATLRAQWTMIRTQTRTADQGTAPDYRIMKQDLDLNKAKRLIRARKGAIQNTKTLIEKYKAASTLSFTQ